MLVGYRFAIRRPGFGYCRVCAALRASKLGNTPSRSLLSVKPIRIDISEFIGMQMDVAASWIVFAILAPDVFRVDAVDAFAVVVER